MRWLVLMLLFAALVADTYIYFSFIAQRFRHLSGRIVYVILALLTDGAALAALILHGSERDLGPSAEMAEMWLVWIFFLALVPKLLYTVGGLLDTLVRLVVRRRVAFFRWLSAALALSVMGVMVYGARAGRTGLRVEEVEIVSDRVPAAFDGYRIAQFSDVHVGTMSRPVRQTARLVEKISGLGADMVVATGDLVNLTHAELTPGVMENLGSITAPDGVWSVWGNHDLGFYIREESELTPEENLAILSEKVGAMGWRVLSDSSVWIHRGGDSLLLTGLDYPHDRMLNSHNETLAGVDTAEAFAGVEGAPFSIVLAHTPKLWERITNRGMGDVTLSGHVHAMQTKIRLFGRTWSPAQYMYREWSGKYSCGGRKKNNVLYINDGIGCVGYPMRIGVRGEITVITLKRCE